MRRVESAADGSAAGVIAEIEVDVIVDVIVAGMMRFASGLLRVAIEALRATRKVSM